MKVSERVSGRRAKPTSNDPIPISRTPTGDVNATARRDGCLVGLLALGGRSGDGLRRVAGGSAADGGSDPYFFGDMGRSIAAGDGFEGYGTLITRRAPLYPLMIGAIFWLFGDHERLRSRGALRAVRRDRGAGVRPRSPPLQCPNGAPGGCLLRVPPVVDPVRPSLHLETLLTFLFTLMIWCAIGSGRGRACCMRWRSVWPPV